MAGISKMFCKYSCKAVFKWLECLSSSSSMKRDKMNADASLIYVEALGLLKHLLNDKIRSIPDQNIQGPCPPLLTTLQMQ